MYDLQLRKGGRLIAKIWSVRTKVTTEREISYKDIGFHIHDTVCFDRDITVRDIFLLFNKNIELFSEFAGCPFLYDIVEEATQPVVPCEYRSKGLSVIVLKWLANNSKEGLFCSPALFGFGLDSEFSLGLISLNEISMLPVVLDNKFEIKEEEEVVFKSTRPFTLLDFTKSFIEEIAHWPPDMREYIGNELNEMYEDDSVEDMSNKLNNMANKHRATPCKICKEDAEPDYFNKPKNICVRCFRRTKEN